MQTKLTRDKIIVLYVLGHSGREVSNSSLSELILELDDMNYFRLQEAISGLLSSGLITSRSTPGTTFYSITPEGSSTLRYMEPELNRKTLEALSRLMDQNDMAGPPSIVTPADYYKTPNGSYEVRCRVIMDNVSQMELTVRVPSEEAAKTVCFSWPHKNEKIYETIMEELL